MKKMVNAFMEKMGGKEECMKMKEGFMSTMNNGTEDEKKQQWQKMCETMSKFGEHAKEYKPEFGQNWGGCGKNWGTDGEGNSWN